MTILSSVEGTFAPDLTEVEVFQTAAEQNGRYASKSECDRLMHSQEWFTRGRK
jgi:hypothetical protein